MNVSDFIKADSSQWNADDLMDGNLKARISKVTEGSKDQPVNIHLEGHQKVWRPCKTSLRVLVATMGSETEKWVGTWVELYRDEHVKWGGTAVGGIRIKALSSIDRKTTLGLTETRGKKAPVTVEPLTPPSDDPKGDCLTLEQLANVRAIIEELGDKSPSEGRIAKAYGVEELEYVPSDRYGEIVARLEAKR